MSFAFHTLRQEQWVDRPLDEVFAFFSDAHNLQAITPPWLKCRVLSMDTDQIREGTHIRYRLSLRGLPMYWTTEIRHWNAPDRFVDIQTSGPYRLWHHTHLFQAYGDRTRMMDVVRYRLPLGFLGRLLNALMVKNDVRKIFTYRRQKIEQLFPTAIR